MDYKEKLALCGAAVPEILFPAENVKLEKFACIACDQFNSLPQYWDETDRLSAGSPRALDMMMPEAWLVSRPEHQAAIPAVMDSYLKSGALRSLGEGMMFVKRQTSSGERKGLLLNLSLDDYDYRPGAQSLIRPTEKTVESYLPPRIAVRKSAPLEMPHILVLIADKEDRLMDLLEKKTRGIKELYDFTLMQGGGRIRGKHISDEAVLDAVADVLLALKENSDAGFLFAAGDGNHSLAAAKEAGDRYVLAEVVNLYDPAIEMEPIHRLLRNVDPLQVQKDLGFDPLDPPDLQKLQPRLDSWMAAHPGSSIEYVHGAEECKKLAERPGSLAIVWGSFDKDSLFRGVAEHGVLQRKSFSMGRARDKRYYLECQKRR